MRLLSDEEGKQKALTFHVQARSFGVFGATVVQAVVQLIQLLRQIIEQWRSLVIVGGARGGSFQE